MSPHPRPSRRPRIALPVLLAALAACAEPARPSLVLVTLDTLRADHVGAYGDGARTPNLDRLARAATVFEQAHAPMPMTLPSHFSLFTGRYPREHGVVSNALALPQSAETLAERLRAAGYATAGFVAVSLLDAESGAAQGFERFDAPRERQRRAEEVVPRALEWLASRPPGEPVFLWVHLFDPHLPYAPPPDFRRDLDARLAGELPALELATLHRIALANGGDLPRKVFEHARGLYRGEVEYLDHWIGRLLEGVDARRAPEETLTVVVADHGESFEDGVFFEHSESLGEGALRVPLLIRYPPRFAPGARVARPASLVDLAPTLLEALGLAPLPGVAGRSLLAPEEPRAVLVQHPVYTSETLANRQALQAAMRSVAGEPTRAIVAGEERVGVIDGGHKLLRSSAGATELFALEPGGRERAVEDPATRARLLTELERLLAQHPFTLLDDSKVDEALLEELRDLGYAR